MDAADELRKVTRVRCVWLRTKAMYLNPPQAGADAPAHSDPAWWCHRSGDAFGPDGHVACSPACDRPGRACYEGPPVL